MIFYYLCGMKIIYLVLLLSLLAACSRSGDEARAWLWTETVDSADSISIKIDYQHSQSSPRDSIIHSIDRLLRVAETQKDSDVRSLLMSRYHYMMSRQARSDGDLQSASRHLADGVAMIDSAKYPYEFHRFRSLGNSMKPENSKDVFIEILRDLNFYRTHGDAAMEAGTAIIVGHKLADAKMPEKALQYYLLADSIYNVLGMKAAGSKNRINIANQLAGMDDDERCDSLLAELRADPYIKGDPRAYNIVLRNSYLQSGDIAFLREVYSPIMNDSVASPTKTLYEIMLSRYYIDRQRIPDSADYYS